MKITSLKIAKLLSFGPQQDLRAFTSYNLFIGKNGTGKTNTFTILQGLDVDYEMVGGSDFKIPLQTHDEVRQVNVFQPSVLLKNYTNRQCYLSNIEAVLEIAYTLKSEGAPAAERISFTDDHQATPRYNGGDVSVLKKRVRLLKIPETDAEFYKGSCGWCHPQITFTTDLGDLDKPAASGRKNAVGCHP